MHVTRRQFLATTASLSVGAASFSSQSRAATDEYLDAQPSHVTLSFDRDMLEAYRPRLDLTAVETNTNDTTPSAMYAWLATSPEHDTDVAVYFTRYPYQQGLVGLDSHYGDREPVYVYIDSKTGDVESVAYSAYHWLKATAASPPLFDDQHPELSVVSPWHQYALGNVSAGEFVSVESLGDSSTLHASDETTEFEAWLDNGLDEALEPGTVVNPWTMKGRNGRGHWWRETAGSFSKDAFLASTLYAVSRRVPAVDIGGATDSDQLD